MGIYRCHKIVDAWKIRSMEQAGELPVRLEVERTGANEAAGFEVEYAWFLRHKPEIGGYFVQYRDGYASYSPAEAFERGYVPIDELAWELGDEHESMVTLVHKPSGATFSWRDPSQDELRKKLHQALEALVALQGQLREIHLAGKPGPDGVVDSARFNAAIGAIE